MAVLAAAGLTKRFRGGVLAVDGLDLTVGPGEIYGFLGLNGAGKTTTIRMLLGMARPTAGAVEVFGEAVRPGTTGPWARVGHLVETATSYPELSVRENLEVAARLARLADGGAVARVIGTLHLGAYADRRAGTLSHGNRQRLGVARALLSEPDLLVLDEPANGLDPAGVVEIRELLRTLAGERGVTVFMSSHILAEVDRLATRIGIIHEGRLIEELSAAELDLRRRRRLVVETRDPQAARRVLEAAGYSPTPEESAGHTRWALGDPRAIDEPERVATTLVQAGTPPVHLAVVQEDLEAHFLRLTGGGS